MMNESPPQFEEMERQDLINHIDKRLDEADKNLDDCVRELE